METRFDISAIGECLIDIIINDETEDNKLYMEGNPGGAPTNVLASASKLGAKTGMICKIGNDSFGKLLVDMMKDNFINTDGVIISLHNPTTLAIVKLDKHGDRSFSFYRNMCADIMLQSSEVKYELIAKSRIFHFGSVSMTNDPSKSATIDAICYAKRNNVKISFDPNLRIPLWDNSENAKNTILFAMKYADYVKVSQEELIFLTGSNELEAAARCLFSDYPMELLVVTLGQNGCFCKTGKGEFTSQAYDISPVDTTGAGDAFWGTVLFNLLKYSKVDEISEYSLINILDMANAAGSLVVGKNGAISSLPCMIEIENCMNSVPRVEIKR